MKAKNHNPWARLTDEQLQGANFALLRLYTWPGFRGDGLQIIRDDIEDTYEEMARRKPKAKPTKEGGER